MKRERLILKKIAVVGLGYWGKKLLGVVVASWENTHYELVRKSLEAGKHVLVEKPMCLSYKEGKGLVEIAEREGVVLMVDNTFVFDEAFLSLKEKIDKGEIGRLKGIESRRFSSGVVKPYTDVVFDLLPHDLALFEELEAGELEGIGVGGKSLVAKNIDNVWISLNYERFWTRSFLSWTSPYSKREMVVYGDEGVLVWRRLSKEKIALRKQEFSYGKEIESFGCWGG